MTIMHAPGAHRERLFQPTPDETRAERITARLRGDREKVAMSAATMHAFNVATGRRALDDEKLADELAVLLPKLHASMRRKRFELVVELTRELLAVNAHDTTGVTAAKAEMQRGVVLLFAGSQRTRRDRRPVVGEVAS